MSGTINLKLPWRVGRSVGRTIYVQVDAEPSDQDVLIGMMDTPAIARRAVADHNVTTLRPNQRLALIAEVLAAYDRAFYESKLAGTTEWTFSESEQRGYKEKAIRVLRALGEISDGT